MERMQFEGIFSDAHVVDVDLSRWDKSIDLYVLADHMGRVEGNRLPLFVVQFIEVRRLSFERSVANPELGPDEHVQWLIDDFRIEEAGDEVAISLWGHRASPRIELVCRDVDINPVELRVFDELFPGWNQPSRGLARPGARVMANLLSSSPQGLQRNKK